MGNKCFKINDIYPYIVVANLTVTKNYAQDLAVTMQYFPSLLIPINIVCPIILHNDDIGIQLVRGI